MSRCDIGVRVLNYGGGRDYKAAAIWVTTPSSEGDTETPLTPNAARLLIQRLERAIEDCELRTRTGGRLP